MEFWEDYRCSRKFHGEEYRWGTNESTLFCSRDPLAHLDTETFLFFSLSSLLSVRIYMYKATEEAMQLIDAPAK